MRDTSECRALAYWATGPFTGEIRPEPLPRSGVGEVLVRSRFGAVSRGTEALVAAGRVPPSQAQRMRCPFQGGSFPFPVKYGYCTVGEVEAGPASLVGRTVFCLHPHQTRFVVPAEAVTPVPAALPAARAVLAANLETALNGLWDAGILPGDRVVVVGAGVVGCLAARLAGLIPGTEVTLVDRLAGRADVAAALGVGFATADAMPGEADLVIEASGNGEALAACLAAAGDEATILALSWYGADMVRLPLGEAFHSRRLRLVASQVGMVAGRQRARWDRARRMGKVMELLADPALDALVTGEAPFSALPEILPKLAREPGVALCHRIRYEE